MAAQSNHKPRSYGADYRTNVTRPIDQIGALTLVAVAVLIIVAIIMH